MSGLLGFHGQGKELALEQRYCKSCWTRSCSQEEQGSRNSGCYMLLICKIFARAVCRNFGKADAFGM